MVATPLSGPTHASSRTVPLRSQAFRRRGTTIGSTASVRNPSGAMRWKKYMNVPQPTSTNQPWRRGSTAGRIVSNSESRESSGSTIIPLQLDELRLGGLFVLGRELDGGERSAHFGA